MAPELFQPDGVYSFASDFWALGCMMYEFASGKPPFYSKSFKELVELILHKNFAPLTGISPDLNDLIGQLLEKDPAKRISWPDLKTHNFWKRYQFQSLKLPQ